MPTTTMPTTSRTTFHLPELAEESLEPELELELLEESLAGGVREPGRVDAGLPPVEAGLLGGYDRRSPRPELPVRVIQGEHEGGQAQHDEQAEFEGGGGGLHETTSRERVGGGRVSCQGIEILNGTSPP